MSDWYEYLVEYAFDGGSGRSFSIVGEPLNSSDAVLRLEDRFNDDTNNRGLRNLNIRRFQLLREWSE
jgi:hypothetical protein